MMKEIEVVLPPEISDGEYELITCIDEDHSKGIVSVYEEKATK
jgi:hypothetical protein